MAAQPIITEVLQDSVRESSREERGRELYLERGNEISYLPQECVWLVPSEHDLTSVYEVRLGDPERESCECKDFEFNGHRQRCKHICAARLCETFNPRPDALAIDYPLEEELLAAVEYALKWFRAWEQHAPEECAFGGEHAVMKKLRRAVQLARKEP